MSEDAIYHSDSLNSDFQPKIDLAKVITDKIRDDEESGAAEADWKFAAMVISCFKKRYDVKQLVIFLFNFTF